MGGTHPESHSHAFPLTGKLGFRRYISWACDTGWTDWACGPIRRPANGSSWLPRLGADFLQSPWCFSCRASVSWWDPVSAGRCPELRPLQVRKKPPCHGNHYSVLISRKFPQATTEKWRLPYENLLLSSLWQEQNTSFRSLQFIPFPSQHIF